MSHSTALYSPGSTVGQATIEESITFIAECINKAHKETSSIVIVIENMVTGILCSSYRALSLTFVQQAGAGNVIGGPYSQLGGIIERVEDKTRVGVCLDTCMILFPLFKFFTLTSMSLERPYVCCSTLGIDKANLAYLLMLVHRDTILEQRMDGSKPAFLPSHNTYSPPIVSHSEMCE